MWVFFLPPPPSPFFCLNHLFHFHFDFHSFFLAARSAWSRTLEPLQDLPIRLLAAFLTPLAYRGIFSRVVAFDPARSFHVIAKSGERPRQPVQPAEEWRISSAACRRFSAATCLSSRLIGPKSQLQYKLLQAGAWQASVFTVVVHHSPQTWPRGIKCECLLT